MFETSDQSSSASRGLLASFSSDGMRSLNTYHKPGLTAFEAGLDEVIY